MIEMIGSNIEFMQFIYNLLINDIDNIDNNILFRFKLFSDKRRKSQVESAKMQLRKIDKDSCEDMKYFFEVTYIEIEELLIEVNVLTISISKDTILIKGKNDNSY